MAREHHISGPADGSVARDARKTRIDRVGRRHRAAGYSQVQFSLLRWYGLAVIILTPAQSLAVSSETAGMVKAR